MPFSSICNTMSDEKNSRMDTIRLMIDHLSQDEKLQLIALLTESLRNKKRPRKRKKTDISEFYGILKDDKLAEQWIEDIRSSRVFNRKLESF